MFLFRRNNIYYFSANGRRISTKTKTKTEALRFIREYQQQGTIDKSITLLSFRGIYLKYSESVHSKAHQKGSKEAINYLIEVFTGGTILSDIKPDILERKLSEKFKETPYYAHLLLRTLKAIFTRSEQWHYIDSNPLKKMKLPRLPKKNPTFISETELSAIVDTEENSTLKAVYTTAFYTGLRLGEILNLKWNAVSFENRTVKVSNTESFQTKSRKDRTVPLSDTLFSVLTAMIPRICNPNNDYIFHSGINCKLNESFVSHRFKDIIRELKLNPDIHFHSLRHSFASFLVQKGVSLFVVKELLGHSSYATTQIYSHLQTEVLTEAISKFNKVI